MKRVMNGQLYLPPWTISGKQSAEQGPFPVCWNYSLSPGIAMFARCLRRRKRWPADWRADAEQMHLHTRQYLVDTLSNWANS